jgi:hypothetical protein
MATSAGQGDRRSYAKDGSSGGSRPGTVQRDHCDEQPASLLRSGGPGAKCGGCVNHCSDTAPVCYSRVSPRGPSGLRGKARKGFHDFRLGGVASRGCGAAQRPGTAWPGLRGGRKERMKGSRPARMPLFDPGFCAPAPPAIPIAPLHPYGILARHTPGNSHCAPTVGAQTSARDPSGKD